MMHFLKIKTIESWKILLVFSCLFVSLEVLADFQIVKDGKPAASILLTQPATKSAQLGALELQYHIRLMTGAELPIVSDQKKITGNCIRIGGKNDGMRGDSSRILFQGNTLLLTGSDTPIYTKVDYKHHGTFPQIEYECKGSLFAVYDFLENYCGVRFYGMGDIGTTYPVCKNLSVQEKNRNFTPSMDAFRLIYTRRLPGVTARDFLLWKLRWRMSLLYGNASHNHFSIYFAHWDKAKDPKLARAFKGKKHDLFAKGYEGKAAGVDAPLRQNYPNDRSLPPQVCYSNPETVRFFADEAITYMNGGCAIGGWRNTGGDYPVTKSLLPKIPGCPYYYPYEGGDTGGYCLCEKCQGRFPHDTQMDISNNKFQFVSDLAREVAKRNPEAGISTLAYVRTLKYPDQVKLADNVSVQLCLTIFSWWHPVSKDLQVKAYKEWVDKEAKKRPLTLWTYIFSTYWDADLHFGKYKPFPGFYPWKIGEIFQMFTKDGIRGWFSEAQVKYMMLESYVASKLCYDASADPKKLIDDYFANYYGAAGPAMKEFYKEVERAYWNAANCPAEWLKDKNVFVGPKGPKHPYWGTGLHSRDINWQMGTPERMKKLSGLIEQAKKAASTPAEKARVQKFIDVIWKGTLEGYREYQLIQHRRSMPQRNLIPAYSADLQGDPEKADWSKAPVTEQWGDCNGKDIQSRCSVQAIHDDNYVYFRCYDPRKPDMKADFWNEDFEIFFTTDKKYPVFQLAFSPSGEYRQYKHDKISLDKGGAVGIKKCDLSLNVKNIVGKDSWTLLIAIPKKNLPISQNSLNLNFMRTSAAGNAVWNPIYTNVYLLGIDSFGEMQFFPRHIEENEFNYYQKGKHTFMETDNHAANGKCGAMLANFGWSLSYPFPKNMIPGKYKIIIRVRTDAKPEPGMFSSFGVHDTKMKKTIASKPVFTKDIAGEKYTQLEFGPWELNADRYFYIGGLSKKAPGKKIFLDSIKLEYVSKK